MKQHSVTLYRWLNGLAFLALLAVNALANLLPIGGVTTGQVSEKYTTLFTPASITFGIWGLIYLLLAGFILFQAGTFHALRSREGINRTGLLFILSCLCNIGWLISWHYFKLGFAVLWIFALLFCLIPLSARLYHIGVGFWEKAFTRGAFSLYFGWITIAAISNVTTWLKSIGWNGFGLPETFWMILILIAGAIIGCLTTLRRRDWLYPLAIIWGYAGILIRHLSRTGFQGAYPGIILTAALCVTALCISAGLVLREEAAF